MLIARLRAAAAAFAADLSEVAVNRLCRRCGDTCKISFLRSSSSLRFGVVREGQHRARASVSKRLVAAARAMPLLSRIISPRELAPIAGNENRASILPAPATPKTYSVVTSDDACGSSA